MDQSLPTNTNYGADTGLATIDRAGKVPMTRMGNPDAMIDFNRRLWDNDMLRSQKRALVRGLVDGNRPYKATKLRDAGRAEACNVNWGTARTYMESGVGAFYDLSSEAPGLVQIQTSHGDPEHRDEYSRIMSAKADMLLKNDEDDWDFEMQQSLNEMVLHGRGPMIFEDPWKIFPRSIHDGDLKVTERTPATMKRWEIANADINYYPPELYAFIRDEKAATDIGWNVEYTKRVIADAMDIRQPDNHTYNFEFYQDEMKNNSLAYYDDSKICKLAFVYFKEFDGKITQCVVQRENTTDMKAEFLFQRIGRYGNFVQCCHPFYFDRGNGGYHHSVTGLGVKLYAPMEYENRLLCNLMDKAFAPKTLFKPTSTEATQRMQLATYGDYAVLPAGWEAMQNPIQGFLNDGLAMYQTSGQLMKSNLSSYRAQTATKEGGNPATKYENQMKAAQDSALSKTTINRYYKQLDVLYAEMVRRMFDINSPEEKAKELQKACIAAGVPKECFGRIESVKAVRVVGEGSPFMRKQSIQAIMPIVGRLPEEGALNWTNDFIASNCGQASVERYNPVKKIKKLPSDQQFMALEGITMAKTGVAPIITSSQNPVTFAAAYLKAAVDAINSLQQGADLGQVVHFLEIIAPGIHAHAQRFANDPIRKPVYKEIMGQFKRIAKVADELKKRLAQQQQQAAKAKAQQSDQALRAAKTFGDLALKKSKQDAMLKMRQQSHKQNLAIADARAGSEIMRNNRLAAFRE